MRVGVANDETWRFFNEIYEELENYHAVTLFKQRKIQTPIFNQRINRFLFRRDLQALMEWSDVFVFEWASHLLASATQMPKVCKIVTRLHRYEMYQWVDKINWMNVDKIILVSEAKRKEFIDLFPNQESKTAVIPVGVSLDDFKPSRKAFTGDIGILCHLTPRKRVYDLLLTFYELSRIRDGFHLHIAGGEQPDHQDYYFSLKDAVRELKLEDSVTFYDNVFDTSNWYQKIDVFISNSYSEGLQVAPMEAMASGCYCLSHRWKGADELLPEENLYFTGQELIQKILAYAALSNAEKLQIKGYMRELAGTKFDIEKLKLEFRQLIESVGS